MYFHCSCPGLWNSGGEIWSWKGIGKVNNRNVFVIILCSQSYYRGGFSIVREAVNKQTKEKVAVKFIEKKFVDQEELKLLQREIDIMARVSILLLISCHCRYSPWLSQVQHRNVLRLFEIFDTTQQLSLVMELYVTSLLLLPYWLCLGWMEENFSIRYSLRYTLCTQLLK